MGSPVRQILRNGSDSLLQVASTSSVPQTEQYCGDEGSGYGEPLPSGTRAEAA